MSGGTDRETILVEKVLELLEDEGLTNVEAYEILHLARHFLDSLMMRRVMLEASELKAKAPS